MKNDQEKILEVTAVVITGLLKFIMMDWLDWRLFYIVGAIVCWSFYLFWKQKSHPNLLPEMGFRKTNFKVCFLALLPLAAISVVLFFIYGWYFNTLILSWSLIPILLLYPIWGLIQQFLIVGLIAGNLNTLEKTTLSKTWIMLITASVFAIVHYPSLLLIGGTFLLALVYTHFYLRYKNLWPLALYHGWLGGFFFYFVLERNVWAEVFGSLGG